MKSIVAAVVLLALACTDRQGDGRHCDGVEATFRFQSVSEEVAHRFEEEFCDAVRRVRNWWGPTYAGRFNVRVDDSRGPSMALVPGWRGRRGEMLFRSDTVGQGRAATIHEVLHVFAPNANRFLAEGLAVHAHDFLGGNPAFPNFGADLHRLSRGFAAVADLAALDGVATPAPLGADGPLNERARYIVAGSFVRYLIESRGLAKFREIYAVTPLDTGRRSTGDRARWRRVYGADLDELAKGWRSALQGR